MKFGDVMLRQKALPGKDKTFDDIITMTFFMTSSCILGSVWLKSRKS